MLVDLYNYLILMFFFGDSWRGGLAYVDKSDKARGKGVGQMLTLADKGGRGV